MIPHCVKLFPAQYLNEADYQNEYTYQLIFDCKDPSPVKKIRFEGIMLQFDCYLNGKDVGHFISGYLPVEIDVSDLIEPKNNILTLFVDGREDPSIPPFGKVVDYLTFAGIYREVSLSCLPLDHIDDVFVEASADGKVSIKLQVEGNQEPHYVLLDHGEVLLEERNPQFRVENPHLWSVDDPYLYDMDIHYGQDCRRVSFGFRDASFKAEGFFLNGKRVPLIGLNRHQTYPYFGPAAPKALQEEDAQLLKRSGINLVRTSHYPQSEHFLNACDRLGIFVIDEIPGWQYIGKSEKWRQNCVDFARRMILKERNHPCLIAYGLRIDESADDDELYGEIAKVHQELDPRRNSLGVRNFKDSHCLEDVYGYNDFSCSDLSHGADPSSQIKGGKGKAILITESNGHMYPTKPFDAPEKRREHALRHAKVLEDVLADHGYVGAVTWCAFDYNTHRDFGSCDHICHHGVYDIFRNPKYAASFFQSQGEEKLILEVASSMQPSDYDEALLPKVYVFTNADYVEMYRGNKRIGAFYPDAQNYPHLPHPPIVIDDIIGELFDEPNISKEDAKKIISAFNYCAQNGFNKLRLRDKVSLAFFMSKYHVDFSYVYATYAKYIQSWGEGSSLWRFDAVKGGKKVASILRGPSTDFHLDILTPRDTLIHQDTYDCLSVHIYKKDQYGTVAPYAFDSVVVETSGPIEVYGPKLFSLFGGASTIYVRSLPCKGTQEGVLRITCMGETLERRFLVKA